jgi:hypothetical protein
MSAMATEARRRGRVRAGWAACAVLIGAAALAGAQVQDPALIDAAAQELAAIEGGKEPKLSTGRLVRAALKDADPAKRVQAVNLVVEVLREPELGFTVQNQKRYERWLKQARAVILQALADPDPQVRSAALKAAQALSEQEVAEVQDLTAVLTRRVRDEPLVELRSGAFELPGRSSVLSIWQPATRTREFARGRRSSWLRSSPEARARPRLSAAASVVATES